MAIDKERIAGQEDVETKKAGEMVDVRGHDLDKLPPEVESWIEEVEKQGGRNVKQVIDDQGQTVMTSIGNDDDDVKLKLPVSRKTFSTGFSLAVNRAGRWLSEFLFRLIKKKKIKVEFKEDDKI